MRKIIFYHGEYCPPCRFAEKNILPILEKYGTVEKINLNENPRLARKLKISSIPTYYYLEDGKLVMKKIGNIDLNKTVNWLRGDSDD